MISAFKHIRLSGQNLIPLKDVSYNGSDILRLSLGNTGLAYYSELTGVSGYLQSLINVADDDVTRVNDLKGSVTIQGSLGIGIGVDTGTNTITISGADSGYFQGLIDSLSGTFDLSGLNLAKQTESLSGTLNQTGLNLAKQTESLSGTLNVTGANLEAKITSLSGDLGQTGLHVYANFVRKATQQSFTTTLPANMDSTGIQFPVAFSSTPASVNVTLEIPGDVSYMVAIKNKSSTGFTAEFSDVILEENVKLNTFARLS